MTLIQIDTGNTVPDPLKSASVASLTRHHGDMDGSTSALIAASFGLVGTAVGSTVTAWTTRVNAKKGAHSARQQVYDKAAADHAHWERQQRLTAYEGFLEAWDQCLRITQASGAADAADSATREELIEAASRMTERARRISLLGPEEVTRAAEELAATMQEDVEVSTRFIEAASATIAALDGRPVPSEALAIATEKFKHRRDQVEELVQATLDQGGDLRDLDGHPLLSETIASAETYKQASKEAHEALEDNLQRLSAILDEAEDMIEALGRNKEARELSREHFTKAVRKALGTSPIIEQ